jgi:hypothetical protein
MKPFPIRLPHLFLSFLAAVSAFHPMAASAQAAKPPITLDEYLNTTDIVGARISPDGTAAVIGTESPDWKASAYRHTLWLWTAKDGLRALTQSGTDEDAEWSPDGKWIAFLSDRPVIGRRRRPSKDSGGDAKAPALSRSRRRLGGRQNHPPLAHPRLRRRGPAALSRKTRRACLRLVRRRQDDLLLGHRSALARAGRCQEGRLERRDPLARTGARRPAAGSARLRGAGQYRTQPPAHTERPHPRPIRPPKP